jgi:outer membrane lipoprotein-sorting protein
MFLTFFCLCFFNSSIIKASTRLQVNNFFENLKTLEADFIQVGPSGNVSNGKVYFDLPGKLRIDYQNPNNILITCKGFWIVIQNRELKTTNNIPLKNSPFSILLENQINLSNKTLYTEFKNQSGIVSLTIKGSNNNQAGELILEFSEKPLNLKKWIIKDIFGEVTTVLIQNAKYNKQLSHLLFFPDDFPEPIN